MKGTGRKDGKARAPSDGALAVRPATLLSRIFYYLSSIWTLARGIRNWPILLPAFLKLPMPRPFLVKLRTGLVFRAREPMDIWAIKETCLDRFYEKASVALEPDWTVVDLGGGLGDFTVLAARSCPRGLVYAYEPFPDSFSLLQENVRLNGLRNVRAFPCAVSGQESATLPFYETGSAVQHRTAGAASGEADGNLLVSNTTLDEIFDSHRIVTCDFLKIDCEGAEFDILFRASERTLSRIRTICLEYHDDVTSFGHQDLARYLEARGFRVKLLPNLAHRELGYLCGENLVFLAENPATSDKRALDDPLA